MLTTRYMTSVKNLASSFDKIVEGTAPKKFTRAHLKGIGFKSSNDVGVIPVLKDLGLLSAEGAPTQRYHDYRDKSRSKAVMTEALQDAYEDLFHISEKPTTADREAIEGKFKSAHNTSDRVAAEQTKTFYALLKLADLDATGKQKSKKVPERQQKEKHEREEENDKDRHDASGRGQHLTFAGLRYNVEIHLPATKDVEVYNAIFKSLKEHLLED
jgi:hypothetical protein